MKLSDKYREYCHPRLAGMMQAVRLDVSYHRGEGDYLFFYSDSGEEVRVMDFAGGSGASLFGHNNSRLVNKALNNLESRVPFNSQFSCHGNTALLCERLGRMFLDRTGRRYIAKLASTGTEIVEAAIKHAEYTAQKQINNLHRQLKNKIILLNECLAGSKVSLSPNFFEVAGEMLGSKPGDDFMQVMMLIQNYNYRIFRKPPYFLSLINAFHGKTTGSLQLTYNPDFRSPFSRIGPKVIFVDYEDYRSLNRAVEKASLKYFWIDVNENNEVCLIEKTHPNISAMFIEPIQGEGGINIVPKSFLEYCAKASMKFGFPLVFDEIQCGMGRTGTFLYSEQQGLFADYYLLSKSLGGGLSKISVMMIREDFYDDEFELIHTSTFAEDDHSSAIALEALSMLENDPGIMENCREKENLIKEGIEEIKKEYPEIVKDVRGKGLMLGIEFHDQGESGSIALRMLSTQKMLGYIIQGFLLHEFRIRVSPMQSNNFLLRIEPSAFIGNDDCRELIKAVRRVSEVLYKQNIYMLVRYIVNAEVPFDSSEVESFRKEYKPYYKPDYAKKVAFIGHLIDAGHLALLDRGFSLFTEEQLKICVDRIYPYVGPEIYDQMTVKSATGEIVNLNFIGLLLDSKTFARHMADNDIKIIHDKIEEAVELAVKQGCTVVGLGGYTSIVTNNCENIITDSIALTSGNALTVAMGLESIYKASADKGIELGNACFAAVGATGNICSIYSEIIAEQVPRIILIGRPGREDALREVASEIYFNAFKEILLCRNLFSNCGRNETDTALWYKDLKGVAGAVCSSGTVKELLECYKEIDRIGPWLMERIEREMGENAPVIISTDITSVKEANLILCASNSPEPVIYPIHLGEGPVVICDISVPMDTHRSIERERKDVTIMQGGVVRLPVNSEFSIAGVPLELGHSFACMAETILLGLTGITEHYSFGKINKIIVKKILEIANLHGFSLARLKTEKSY